ncbi:sirohydrochlorin cobaltochelatase [Desulfonatronovibrio hydrogenovorans]|uniref:sirohydrochlorin cobaltochelatase n=1 Tax=Desulfonatronovibrio hydrogenovorans TaxID=53245 RepID=UPI001378BA86|nr:sirohydrochlorin cobaltochelatase [Desulfonatronovibrio hydrogenovorans]
MNKDGNSAILLAAFGTSVPGADQVYADMEKKVRADFPGLEIYWAYTSKVIREKLARQGRTFLSPVQALGLMAEHGLARVAMQSLLIIPGLEHHDLIRTRASLQGLPKGIEKISLGAPLLNSSLDIQRFTRAMLDNVQSQRSPEEAVIFMGHGSTHPANVFYAGLQYQFWLHDENIFVGAVEGTPALEDILPLLKKRGVSKALLLPLMVVAGDHAINDMAGKQTGSWMSTLEDNGVEARVLMQGLGSFDNVVDIWMDHLKEAVASL